MEKSKKLTPMYEQYMGIKEEYPDALLFYRMGDFYELFFEDARIASRELQLALTSRNKDADNPIPMCGVPWHAAQNYIGQLVEKGYCIAVCDQLEEPSRATGIVKRGVTRVITPGTILEDDNLSSKENNFLASIWQGSADYSIAWLDISTGRWSGIECKNENEMWQFVQKINPAELLIPDDLALPDSCLPQHTYLMRLKPIFYDLNRSQERIFRAQRVKDAASVGLQNKSALIRACGALVAYLDQTQKCNPDYLLPFRPLDLGKRLVIDEITEKNLEIFCTLDGKKGKGTLRHVLDNSLTPMGGRFLEDMLKNPWRELAPIQHIQAAVFFLHENDSFRNELRELLQNVFDLERITTRINLHRATAKDFISLRSSLAELPKIKALFDRESALKNAGAQPGSCIPLLMENIMRNWDSLDDCARLLNNALADSPPAVLTDGGIFKSGFNAELDKLVDLVEHGESKLRNLLEEEQKNTGICKLKLGYNRVFGYYYEISRAALDRNLPEYFIRRQSLANNERFTTPQLKRLESDIISAHDKRKSLEFKMFLDLRDHISSLRERIVHMADLIAQIDYWQSLAHVARKNRWSMPCVDESFDIEIKEGRHPVIEAIQGSANFVPNDFTLDTQRRLCLLTGPNMSGKSTILRQVAIIALLAHMGSMVPASYAKIGLVDRLFSRVGASDNLAKGLSTFMVEMMETARILRQATKRSLVILDEIGRGTSTYDGLAIAWSVMEYLAEKAAGKLRTIFATHYHELTYLEGRINGVFTMNIAIQECNNSIIFLHKLLPGPADKSYGIEVARLSGIPNTVVQRARKILADFEKGRTANRSVKSGSPIALPGITIQNGRRGSYDHIKTDQLSHLLKSVSIDDLLPEQALCILKKLKNELEQ